MLKMTLQEFQDELHSEYQGDTDTPADASDEWNHRTRLLKGVIRDWNAEEGITWSELWKQLSDNSGGDGDKTVLAAILNYACPTDFDFPGGFVKTTGSDGKSAYWDVVTQERAEILQNEGVQACYFTGNQSAGYVLHFITQPTAGDTINYPYYKTPIIPSDAADIIEMSDPRFSIQMCLSKMHEIDGEGDRSTKAFRLAQSTMVKMRRRNVLPVYLQENKVSDREAEIGEAGFGE